MSLLKACEVARSEHLYIDKSINIRKDIVIASDTQPAKTFYVLQYPDWVNAVAITEDNEIILVKQYRHGIGSVVTELPGGFMEPDDSSMESAIVRELREETGYAFTDISLLMSLSTNPGTHNNLLHCFLALGGRKVGKPKLDQDENIELLIYPIERIAKEFRGGCLMANGHLTCLLLGLMQLGHIKWDEKFIHQ